MPPCWHRSHKTRTGSQQPARPDRQSREQTVKIIKNIIKIITIKHAAPLEAGVGPSLSSSKPGTQDDGAVQTSGPSGATLLLSRLPAPEDACDTGCF